MNTNHVGVVGLGVMGRTLSEGLIAAEHPASVWDRHSDRIAMTAILGAAPTMSPKHLAEQTDVIFLTLPNPAAVREVLFDGEDALTRGLQPSALIIDMSTSDPALAHEAAQRISELGIGAQYVDAPVSGKSPKLTVMVGGTPGTLRDAEAIVNDIATSIIYTGAIGQGFATKLVHQHVKYATHLAVCEALFIAEKAGLDIPLVIEALEKSTGVEGGFKSAVEYYKGNKRGIAARAPSTTIAKDMNLASALAASVSTESATLLATAEFFTAVVASEYAKKPYPESTKLLQSLRSRAEASA
ncbi:NAD-binding protein [Microbacterium sp. SYP-A9085]|uniref:NAD(P)-dependent oxidoreductase n=1 Tax=Microbacterium sp. SYP-A9085 TaxID=2664454 RepID=UPI00129BCDA8|nr:NAD(P)-dependent oxidoreductase [Microbacterium sp. SYP-A9085]MRH27999.1 NAD-binding protein [Microbacterium sp. SYP-A9085]